MELTILPFSLLRVAFPSFCSLESVLFQRDEITSLLYFTWLPTLAQRIDLKQIAADCRHHESHETGDVLTKC